VGCGFFWAWAVRCYWRLLVRHPRLVVRLIVGGLLALGFWRVVRFAFAVWLPVGFFAVRFRPVGFGSSAVTVKRSEWVFVLGWLAYGAAFRFLWLAAWVGGVVVQRVFPVRVKRHPHAQQVSQRDCPPFRLAKLVFFTGRRLRCSQSRGQPLTVTLFPTIKLPY